MSVPSLCPSRGLRLNELPICLSVLTTSGGRDGPLGDAQGGEVTSPGLRADALHPASGKRLPLWLVALALLIETHCALEGTVCSAKSARAFEHIETRCQSQVSVWLWASR